MKIFISHSSHDKWVARQMSRLLERAGHKTFLDEKDIKTGDVIGSALLKNLRDSDHLLLLISPASLTSQWVFMELGGAQVLEMKVVPILFHVGANEVPAPVAQVLARDINDFDLYLDELSSDAAVAKENAKSKKASARARRPSRKLKSADEVVSSGPVTPPRTAIATDGTEVQLVTEGTIEGYSVGDRVRIVDVANLTEEDKSVPPKWTAPMNRYSNTATHITGLWPDGRFVRLAADDGAFWWLRSWISKIDQ